MKLALRLRADLVSWLRMHGFLIRSSYDVPVACEWCYDLYLEVIA